MLLAAAAAAAASVYSIATKSESQVCDTKEWKEENHLMYYWCLFNSLIGSLNYKWNDDFYVNVYVYEYQHLDARRFYFIVKWRLPPGVSLAIRMRPRQPYTYEV